MKELLKTLTTAAGRTTWSVINLVWVLVLTRIEMKIFVFRIFAKISRKFIFAFPKISYKIFFINLSSTPILRPLEKHFFYYMFINSSIFYQPFKDSLGTR